MVHREGPAEPSTGRHHRGRVALALAIAAALAAGWVVAACAAAGSNEPDTSQLQSTFASIEGNARYAHASWGYEILDQQTGKVLAAQNAQKMFDPGSTMKIYSVSTALRLLGPSYRFRTPVYRDGTVSNGVLSGNLVLVGSGDLTLGLRAQPNGTLYYENTPQLDQSYANIDIADAVEPPGNPLAVLDQLAQAVHAAGITQVAGNVVVDDRLFKPATFPDGLITPIWVNENLIDLLVKPGSAAGQPASIDWRPMTASYTVQNQVMTVASGKATTLQVAEPSPGTLQVSGQIAAGSKPTLRVWEVDDPAAFARTAFIEALQQAGVSVAATATGANPATLLPAGGLPATDMVAEHVSVPLSQYAKLILKVSYNRGADLMTCLAAAKAGSTDCDQGLVQEVETAKQLGVPAASVIPFDGAGSDDQGRTTPAALTLFLARAAKTSWGPAMEDGLPILGRDGTMANVESRSPAAGHAQVKTGNRVVGSPAGQIIVLGNSLAGYAQTKSGRRVTFMIVVGNVPIANAAGFQTVTDDQARMVVALQQDL